MPNPTFGTFKNTSTKQPPRRTNTSTRKQPVVCSLEAEKIPAFVSRPDYAQPPSTASCLCFASRLRAASKHSLPSRLPLGRKAPRGRRISYCFFYHNIFAMSGFQQSLKTLQHSSEIFGFEAPDDHEQRQEHGRFRLAPGSGPRFLKAKGEGHSRQIPKNG